jgi:hypothetical protein
MSAIQTTADILAYLNAHRRYGPEITHDDLLELAEPL